MPSFADSFIKGYTAGAGSKDEKERTKLAREKLEEDRKQEEAKIKRQGEQDKIDLAFKSLTTKQKILDLYKDQDQPVEHGPFKEGLTRKVDVPDVDFGPEYDVLGITGSPRTAKPVFADRLRERKIQETIEEFRAKMPLELEKKQQETSITDEAENVTMTRNIPKIGVKAGEKMKPQELAALVSLHNDGTYKPTMAPANSTLPGLDDKQQKIVNDAVNRYFSGEFKSIYELNNYLGGKNNTLLPYAREIIADNPDIVAAPPAIRAKLVDIRVTQGLIDRLEAQVRNVADAPTMEERTKRSVLLENTIDAVSAMMARGLGEKGALSEGDVKRPKALMPGWIKTNYDPEFALSEVAELRALMGKAKSSLAGYHERIQREGTTPTIETKDGKKWKQLEDGSYEELR